MVQKELVYYTDLDESEKINYSIVCHIDTDPLTLDVATCRDYIGMMIGQATHETLYIRDINSEQLVLGAAKEHRISKCGLIHTFELNNDRFWSTGNPVVAEDFVAMFYRIAKFKELSPIATLLSCILNWDEALDGTVKIEDIGVSALSDYVLEIKLEYEVAYFKDLLGSIYTSPYKDEGNGVESKAPSNGSYYVSEVVKGKHVILKANKYNQKNNNCINTIKFQVCKDINKSIRMYKESQIHMTCNTYFPYDKLRELSIYNDLNVIKDFNIQYWLIFNNNIFNRNMRKELFTLIDRDAIAKSLYDAITPCKSFGYNTCVDALYLKNDISDNDGISNVYNNENMKQITMVYADFYPNNEIANYIKQILSTKLNLDLKLIPLEFDRYVKTIETGSYGLALSLVVLPVVNEIISLLNYLPLISENVEDDFINCLEDILDDESNINNKELFAEAESILYGDMPVIPLFKGTSIQFIHPYIKNFKVFSDGSFSFRNLEWRASGSKHNL